MKKLTAEPTTNSNGYQSLFFQTGGLLQHVSDAVIATDLDFKVLFFNKAAENIYRISSFEILQNKLGDFIHYQFFDTTASAAIQYLKNNGHWQGKVSFVRKDGKTITLLASVSYITDYSGQRTGIVSVNKNITDLEEVQKKSRQYKLRLKSILNGTREALFLVDANYRLLVLNNNAKIFAAKFLNKEPGRNCDFRSLFPEVRRQWIERGVQKALNGENWEYEAYYPTQNLWCLVNYTSVLNEYTEEKEICISARDITERKKREDELKVLSLLAKETANGVMITDEKSIITWVNESFTKVYGYTADELTGKHPEVLLSGPGTDPKTLEQIHKHVSAAKHFNCELASYHKNGSKLWLRLDMQPAFNENKELIKYFVTLTDLTEQHLQKEKEVRNKIDHQKKINRVVLKTQEEISNELGRELHDNVNQILTAAKLQMEVAESNIEGHESFIRKGKESVEEALSEIRRLSKQLTAPRFAETELVEEIHHLLDNLRLAKITELKISGFNEKFLCPEIRLHAFRILQEQLKNIVKYAQAKKVCIILKNCRTNFCLTIKDDGIGFDTKQKKNGIGLTNIRNRVDSYNGTMEVISSPGNGCTLQIKIPLQ